MTWTRNVFNPSKSEVVENIFRKGRAHGIINKIPDASHLINITLVSDGYPAQLKIKTPATQI